MTQLPPEFFWLLLQRSGITAGALRRLARAGADEDAEQWLRWSPPRLRAAGLSDDAIHAVGEWRRCGRGGGAAQMAERDLHWLSANAASLLPINHADYPALLLEIADPPPLLYIRGNVACLSAPQLAVVGSRRATRQGLADARLFAASLAEAGFVVTSGLALGVDAAAHEAAVGVGGTTVAVMGTGLDRIYPAQHRDLADAICQHGALITELPLGTAPRAAHFPSRNRIISGLSLGALIVEAAPQSGSLVTARLALEQNREVYAIPGSIHNSQSRGCNSLIRNGATLVQDARDILDELLGWTAERGAEQRVKDQPLRTAPPSLGADEAAVLEAVGVEPTPFDSILDSVALPVPAVLSALAELELLGLLEARGGSYLRVYACVSASG